MSRLFAIIDWSKKTVHFSGPGTFDARDEIKQLGTAIWRGDKKSWEVRIDSLEKQTLEERFPGIVIDEVGEAIASPAKPGSEKPTLPDGFSVSQIISKCRQAIKSAFPTTVCVYGVLSQVKFRDAGVVFMELAEAERPDERLNCFIWGHAERMCKGLNDAGFQLEPQLQVMFESEIQVSPKDGRISLRVVRIVAEYTLAKVAALREQTNERLKKEGLFTRNKQLSLPYLPKRLGVITSRGGTVIHDFRASLDVGEFGFELFWFPVLVQGNEAKESLLKALSYFSKRSDIDAILVFRGGGSQADLAIFNDYEVARAVCLSPVPVISAIGHQEDQSSVQDVSYLGLGVPKDIGRYFADIVLKFRADLTHYAAQILREGVAKIEQWTQAVIRSPISALAQQVIRNRENALAFIAQRVHDGSIKGHEQSELQFRAQRRHLLQGMQHVLERGLLSLDGLQKLVEAAAPENQLRRGFAIIREVSSQEFILHAAKVEGGQKLSIQFHDGERNVRVEEEDSN